MFYVGGNSKGQLSATIKGKILNILYGHGFEFEEEDLWATAQFNGVGYSTSSDENSYSGDKAYKGVVKDIETVTSSIFRNIDPVIANTKYHVTWRFFPKYSNDTWLRIGGTHGEARIKPTPNEWNKISDIIDLTNKTISENRFRFYHDLTSGYELGDIVYLDDVMVVPIPENNLDGLSIEELDKIDFKSTGRYSTLSASKYMRIAPDNFGQSPFN